MPMERKALAWLCKSSETGFNEVGMEQGIWVILRHLDFRRFSGTVNK